MPKPRKGAYAPLAALYYLDDAILEAGPHAELMWVRILSFLASIPSDGYLTDRQLKMVGIGLRDWNQRVAKLRDVGLLIVHEGGYEARNWHKWNRSAEEVNRSLANDRARKRNTSDVDAMFLNDDAMQLRGSSDAKTINEDAPDRDSEPSNHGENGPISGRNGEPFQTDSRYRAVQSSTEQYRELSASFDAAYSHWPKKVGRKAALEQFHRAAKKTTVPVLVEAVSRFGDAYAATTEKRFVPALDVWLRNERWTDELPAAATAPRMSKASQNAAAFYELYGGQGERTTGIQALGSGVS